MKKIIFFFLSITFVYAQQNPTLYVASPKGLSLREAPNTTAIRIKLLDYGTSITNYSYTNDWVTIDGYYGQWIKTSTNDGKTGYLFDGYTLPVEVPAGGDLKEYFSTIFGSIIFEDSAKNNSDGDDYIDRHTYHFKSGVIYTETSMYESYEASLQNLKLGGEKAYLFYYLIDVKMHGDFTSSDKINYPQKDYHSDTLVIEKDKYPWGSLYISKSEGANYWVKIGWMSGAILLSWGSGV